MNDLLNMDYGIIGRTVATRQEPSTTTHFNFWVKNDNSILDRIEVGNIVAAYYDEKNHSDITFAVISEMSSFSDIDSAISDYLSHDYGKPDIEVPTNVARVVVVKCIIMRNLSGKIKPIEKANVYYPSVKGIQVAYGILDEKGEKTYKGSSIPIGIFENGDGTRASVSIDENFLCGPDGAHLSVSGVSGLASKTSAIQFLIKSAMQNFSRDTAFVVFNVKSKDLLHLEVPNKKLQDHDWSKTAYEILELDSDPFTTTKYFAPSLPEDPKKSRSRRTTGVTPFVWNFTDVRDELPMLLDDEDWDDKMELVWHFITQNTEPNATYDEIITFMDKKIQSATNNQIRNGGHVTTWFKMKSRLKAVPIKYKGLISETATTNDIALKSLGKNEIAVIDIQMLDDTGQKFVFGKVIKELDQLLNNKGLKNVSRVVVFVDELNKYAPSGNMRTPIKSQLINITARGRSLGLFLFGAQQFASSIDKQVIENCSTFFFGRTGSNEIHNQFYSELSPAVKMKLLTLQNGTLLVKFPKFPQPIFIKFPYPPCEPGDDVEQ